MDTAEKAKIIERASGIALAGNSVLAALKIGLGFYGKSLAVVGDGIDSSVDVLIAVLFLAVSRVVARPADAGHPWGHGRAETVAAALVACILFFAGAQLVLNSLVELLEGKTLGIPTLPALAASLVSIAGKSLLALSQYLPGKKAGSAMLIANAKNMRADVILSAGVLAGVGLSMYLSLGFIDKAVTIAVGLWVIKQALGIFGEANLELMDGTGGAGSESYRAVFDAVHSVAEAQRPHRVRMRRIAGLWDIDIDIEVNPHLTVYEAHRIAQKVEQAIKEKVEGVYDIMVHVEPAGNVETEGFGLRED